MVLPGMALLLTLTLMECKKDDTPVPLPVKESSYTQQTDTSKYGEMGPETKGNYGPEDAGHSIGYTGQ